MPIKKQFINSVKYWQPHVPYFTPTKKQKNASLKVAAIVDNRLYQGLRYECTLLLLTPTNWKNIITYGNPHILLVESCLISVTGDWHLAQQNISKLQDDLIEALALAKKKNIPTIFWITQDFQSLGLYKKFASFFDFVFCADPKLGEKLLKKEINSEVLAPAVQPSIFHPFREYDFAHAKSLNILFDGIHDLEQYNEQLSILSDIKKYGLSIIESRFKLIDKRICIPQEFNENILGCVSFIGRVTALKYASAALMLSPSTASPLTQQWLALECAACRIPVLQLGQISNDDIRKDIVIEHQNKLDILTELYKFKEDNLYREELAHIGWRAVNSQHTFSHRLQTICQIADVPINLDIGPSVSAIFASDREEYLLGCVDTFNTQTYKNKEMIIVYNGSTLSSTTKEKLRDNNKKIKLIIAPEEILLGGAINMGVSIANGDYCLKMDDDDLYAENYIYDMMLYTKAVDFDLLGKSQSRFTFFESDDSYWYTNHKKRIPLCIIPHEHPNYPEKMYISGNTICATTTLMKDFPWKTNIPKGSDSKFLSSIDIPITIATTDIFNMAVVRRKDLSTHTWKMSEDKLKKNSVRIAIGKNIPCFSV